MICLKIVDLVSPVSPVSPFPLSPMCPLSPSPPVAHLLELVLIQQHSRPYIEFPVGKNIWLAFARANKHLRIHHECLEAKLIEFNSKESCVDLHPRFSAKLWALLWPDPPWLDQGRGRFWGPWLDWGLPSSTVISQRLSLFRVYMANQRR